MNAFVSKIANRLCGDFDDVDIGVAITAITDEMPQPNDVERVRARLAQHGWPLDEPHEAEGGQ